MSKFIPLKKAGDGGRHGQDRRPAGKLAADRALARSLNALARGLHQHARLESKAQHLAQHIDLLDRAVDVIPDVTEIWLEHRVDARQVGMLQPAADLDGGRRRQSQFLKFAPEFVSSPMGHNGSLKEAYDLVGERKVSFPSKGDDGRKGFAVLEIDSTHPSPDGNWTLRAKYYDANAAVTTPYHTRDYVLREGQFVFTE